jgi:uncharacterized protein
MTSGQPWYRWDDDNLELCVRAQTRSRTEGVLDVAGDAIRVKVNAPPVEGKANQRLIAILAEAFGVSKSRVRLLHGARSRRKWIRIEHPERFPESLESALRRRVQVEKGTKAV